MLGYRALFRRVETVAQPSEPQRPFADEALDGGEDAGSVQVRLFDDFVE
jgi:hypothetical protein